MQLTRFDRWLRKRFVYETQVQTLRRPESIPDGVRIKELPEVAGKRFRFLFTIHNDQLSERFIHQLKEENLMFSTTVVDRQGWYVRWVAPAERSLTWFIIWIILGSIASFFVVRYIYALATNPEVIKMFQDAYNSL
ncbi:MAG: hypothetical protein K9M97_12440 [Akkermansiaceae bacterium]|nr:hypothetical protein [Akkermansiaceae bacterium]